MADPLSITASAAGLISLGVQVVGGITKYLDAVHERRDDVASARQQVIRTQELLKLVFKVAADFEPKYRRTAALLKDCASIQPELQALDDIVRDLDAAKHPSTHQALRKAYVTAKKLTYPFHRPTMDRIQSRLIRLNDLLQAALQVSGLDVAINIERTASAIKHTMPDLNRQLSEQIKRESVASRSSVARVEDSIVCLSRTVDQGLAKVLEDINTTSTAAVTVLQEGQAEGCARVLEELSMTRESINGLSNSFTGINMRIGEIQEDIDNTSTNSVLVLRKDYAETYARILRELAMTQSGVLGLGEAFKRFDAALNALPTREELGRLISKPGQLKELCGSFAETPRIINAENSFYSSRISLAQRTCICRKRVIRSRQARWWGPWQASAETSATHEHLMDCVYHSQGATVTSRRWSLAFKGLRGLIHRAIEVSFSYTFGAGGCSLSPGITYYPTVDRRRDPAFRIMGLFNWACLILEESEAGATEFLEQCLENMALLYRSGKACPRALDLYGRSVLHYLPRRSISISQLPLLQELDTLVKQGVQTNVHDIHGLTPAWNMTCLKVGPWTWDTYNENSLDAMGSPLLLKSYSLLSEFLCARDPCDTIVTKIESLTRTTTLELFGIMQCSPSTAEALGCGPLGLAALAGDSEKMQLVLTNHPNAIDELNILEQTPLHLAIGHPSCVALLLKEAGHKLLNMPDVVGRRPLEYAFFSCLFGTRTGEPQWSEGSFKGHDTGLNALLDADCIIPKMASWQLHVYDSERSLCDDCSQAISVHLVDRSQRLKRLAVNNLPRRQVIALGLDSPNMLDSNGPGAIQALIERGISVPLSLQVHVSGKGNGCMESTSVYHSFGPLPFPLLWSLGFRDLDTPDINGVTPLMLWCSRGCAPSFARCSWLIENGADLWRSAPDGVSTIGHELYSAIGYEEEFYSSIGHWFPEPFEFVSELTEKLSRRDPSDECRCACSPGGCTPFVRFLQAPLLSVSIITPGFMDKAHGSWSEMQTRSAIKYATFMLLGIRHTCCHGDALCPLDRQEEELEELRQEDRFLVAWLEDLSKEFNMEFERMSRERHANKSVHFWDDYWFPRMQQVLKSIDSAELEEPRKVAAEQIGVVWHLQESEQRKVCNIDSDVDFDSDLRDISEDWEHFPSQTGCTPVSTMGCSRMCKDCADVRRHCSERPVPRVDDDFHPAYFECEWDPEIDEEDMFDTFRTVEDWKSRLDLIMSEPRLPSP